MNPNETHSQHWPANMQELYSASVGGTYDAAKYHDIWSRVYGELSRNASGADIPAAALPEAPRMPAPQDAPMPMAPPPVERTPREIPVPNAQRPGAQQPGEYLPGDIRSHCFGRESAKFESELKYWIDDELNDWRYFQALASRAPNKRDAAQLGIIARDEYDNARKLSAALYLISGENYFPSLNTRMQVPPYRQGLREAFLNETRDAAKYAEAARSTGDVCMSEMLNDIAKDEMRHTRDLRGMLENLLR